MPIPRSGKCEYPGCDHAIERVTRSRLCRIHIHMRPYCQCRACKGRQPAAQRPRRDDVREAKVPAFTTYSGVVGYTRVSLPRAPWEADL